MLLLYYDVVLLYSMRTTLLSTSIFYKFYCQKDNLFPNFLCYFFRKSKKFFASVLSGPTRKMNMIGIISKKVNFEEEKNLLQLTFLGYDNNWILKTSRCGIDTQNTKKDQNVSLRGRIPTCNNVHNR